MTVSNTQVRTHFLNVKDYLDEAVYSLIRTQDHDMADEMFLRIKEDEATFAQMARLYSEGPEARQGGVVGPIVINQAHPELARRIKSATIGRIMKPFWLKQFSVILRVEDIIPARFEDHEQQIRDFLEDKDRVPPS